MKLFSRLFGRNTAGHGKNQITYQAVNFQGMGTRDRQEDSFAILNAMDAYASAAQGLFAVVADGMGGMQDGKQVSEAAVKGFTDLFYHLDRKGDIPQQLLDGVYWINQQLYRDFHGLGGTTVIALLLYDEKLFWVSVGDSALYLFRKGELFQLNQEHTYQNQLFLKELYQEDMNKARVMADPDGQRLSSFLGMDRLKQVDYNLRALKLMAGDRVFLCSDGVSKVIPSMELEELLSQKLSEISGKIQERIFQDEFVNRDNYTGIIIACCE